MKLTKENLEKCPDFRIFECLLDGKYVVVNFNEFEINPVKRVVYVKIVGSNDSAKLSSLKPYYDDDPDKNYFEFVQKEYDKIISSFLTKEKQKEKQKSKARKGQVVF